MFMLLKFYSIDIALNTIDLQPMQTRKCNNFNSNYMSLFLVSVNYKYELL